METCILSPNAVSLIVTMAILLGIIALIVVGLCGFIYWQGHKNQKLTARIEELVAPTHDAALPAAN